MRAFEARHGLRALPGGRHPGVGTANAIVPLGDGQYLELITVVDPAEAMRDPGRRRILEAIRAKRALARWAVRVDDLDAAGQVVALGPVHEGARERPDGVRLSWRSAEPALDNPGGGIPFLIEWGTEAHPGAERVEHPAGARRIARLSLEDGPEATLRALLDRLGFEGPQLVIAAGREPRLRAVELATGGEPIVIASD